MIIDKGVTLGDVVTIKLTSGEEIIASFIEENNSYVKVKKPRVLTATTTGIGMVPYLFTVDPDRDVKIYKPISVLELSDNDSASQYTKSTSNIIL